MKEERKKILIAILDYNYYQHIFFSSWEKEKKFLL